MRRIYRLLPSPDGWDVHVGPFTTKAEADLFARTQAVADQLKGGLAQVVVHGMDGQIQTEWTYGADPEETVG